MTPLYTRPQPHCCCLYCGDLPTATSRAAQQLSSSARVTGAAALGSRRRAVRSGWANSSQRGQLAVLAAVKRRTDKHVVCSKTIVATPETAERVVELCKGMMAFSQRRATESDSGILAFDVSQDIYDGNVVHFWERYESNAHLGRHNTSPEFTKFMQDVRPSLPLCTVPAHDAMAAWAFGFGNRGPLMIAPPQRCQNRCCEVYVQRRKRA